MKRNKNRYDPRKAIEEEKKRQAEIQTRQTLKEQNLLIELDQVEEDVFIKENEDDDLQDFDFDNEDKGAKTSKHDESVEVKM